MMGRLLSWAMCAVIGALFAGIIFLTAFAVVQINPPDDTDASQLERSGVRLRTDHATGCQYLEGAGGGLTPRRDASGNHMGCKK